MKKILFSVLLIKCTTVISQPVIVLKEDNIENAYPRLSKDADKILYQSNRSGKWQLYICDTSGKSPKRITDDQFNNNFPDWSSDNKQIAFVSDRDGNEEIYISNTKGKELLRITNNAARDIHPYFSPDGKYILFNSDRNDGQFDIYRYVIATKETERLTSTPENETCARYSPDMKSIVLLKNSATADDVYLLPTSTFLIENVSRTPGFYHGWPVFSNDGKWIYYSSMEKGTYSIYRIHTDGSGKEQLTNAKAGEDNARVSLSKDGRLMIYNIKEGKTIRIVKEGLKN
ncbi:MAG: DPP IV N-terminal domain-containing protein [Bacteroidota bacterium]